MLPVTIKQNALEPVLPFAFQNADGSAFDLTGYTVVVTIVPEQSTTPLLDDASCTINTPNTLGTGYYQWLSGDTATSGRYLYEFTATKGPTVLTLPTDGALPLWIAAALPS